MGLRNFLRVISRHKSIIIAMCLAAIITSTLLTYVLSEKYRSSTTVLIRSRKSVDFVPKSEEILTFPVSYVTPIETASKTYTEIIESRMIAERVVKLIGLEKMKEAEGTGFAYYWRKAKRKIKNFVKKGWILLKYGRIEKGDAISGAVALVQESLSVKPTKETYLFKLQAEASSPLLAASIANGAAEVFLDYLLEMDATEMAKAIELSEEKVRLVKEQLKESRRTLSEFKRRQATVSIKKQIHLELELTSSLEASLESVNTDIDGAVAKKDEIARQLVEFEKFSKSAAKMADNPLVLELRSQLAKKEVALAGLGERYGPEHRRMQGLQAEIEEIKDRLRQETPIVQSEEISAVNPVYQDLLNELARTEVLLESLKAQRDSLNAIIGEKKRLIGRMPEKESELSKLELAVEIDENTNKLLSMEHAELKAAAIKRAPDIRVIHGAIIPQYPASPIKIYHAALAGFLSLTVGVGIALLLESANVTIRSIEEAEDALGLPVLMTVPRLDLAQEDESWPLIQAVKKESAEEKRKYERASVQVPIQIRRHADSSVGQGYLIDLSLGGVCCYVGEELSLSSGDRVDVSLRFEGEPGEGATVEGVVLRSTGAGAGYYFSTTAIEFAELDRSLADKIGTIVQSERRRTLSLLPPPHFEEPIRGLRSDLHFFRGSEMSSFLITSCGPKEGKSTIVANLATSLAGTERKIAVVDADLRLPILHKLLGVPNDMGLSSILSTGAEPSLSMSKSGLSVLTSGPPVDDPPALLGSDRLRQLLDHLSNEFDFVLIDSPPLSAGPDSVLLGAVAHGTIIVLESGTTTVRDSARAKQVLERARAKLLGSVLNNYDSRLGSYYSTYAKEMIWK